MDLNLKGKTALITASSEGLGFACAKELAREGVSVAINARNEEKLQLAKTRIERELGCNVHTILGDLSSNTDTESIAIKAKELLGSIDILVFSSGHPPTLPFSFATDSNWEEGINMFLRPLNNLTRELLPRMKENGYGRLIYIGSIFGLEPEASSVIQSTLKTGLNALSKCIATEMGPYGITSNVLCPGYFSTPLLEHVAQQICQKEQQRT